MRGERRRLRPHLGKLPGEAFAGALWANQNGKKPMPPPLFFERVRNGLKAKSLEWQMLCTENGRVRKSMSGKDLDQNRGNAHILNKLQVVLSKSGRAGLTGLNRFIPVILPRRDGRSQYK